MSTDFRDIAIGAVMIALIVIALFLIVACGPARAEVAPNFQRHATCWHCRDERPRPKPRPRQTRKVFIAKPVEAVHCQPPLAVVGDQYINESGAQGEADKAWMQTARWQHGERYMAREHAADPSYECGRSSVGSAVGQVFYRCRLMARPCRAERKGDK